MRVLWMTLICGLLSAQQQTPPPQKAAPPQAAAQPAPAQDQKSQEPPSLHIVAPVFNVTTPVVVFDQDDNYVSGIRSDQFRLFDNGKEQNIHVDETFTPISMVIAIQCNGEVDKILPQINKIGTMISPILLGQQGEAAVVAFDSRLRVLQDFTSDPDKITTAVRKIESGSMSARLVDAVDESIRMLKTREKSRRRVILLISESRDEGSEGRGRETLIDLQFNNVTVYAVPISRILSKLSAPAPYPRPDPQPPAAYNMPFGKVGTPTTVMQTGMGQGNSADFIPLLVEIYKDSKAIFKAPIMQVFTRGTGGGEFAFYGGRGLEQALQQLGEELHSEYTISYQPNDKEEAGFHKIAVEVEEHPEVKRVQTRPGYWIAGGQ